MFSSAVMYVHKCTVIYVFSSCYLKSNIISITYTIMH